MKQIIKNPLFTFVLGAFLFSGVTYAATVLASNVTYDNANSGINANNVQDAIDSLYTKANNPTIPANYKELSTVTTATSDKILSGYTAYNNNGELLTGTNNQVAELQNQMNSLSTASTKFNFTVSSDLQPINLGFRPDYISCIVNYNDKTKYVALIYNKDVDSSNIFRIASEYASGANGGATAYSAVKASLNVFFTLNNNGVTCNLTSKNAWIGSKFYCVANK